MPSGAVLMAFILAALYWWQLEKFLLEGLLCGAQTLTVASGLECMEWPKSISISISIAIGGGIGFIGLEQFRKLVLNVINIRLGGSNAGK